MFRTQRVREALPDTLFDYIIQNNYLKNFDYGVYWDPQYNAAISNYNRKIEEREAKMLYIPVSTCLRSKKAMITIILPVQPAP